jgi:O-antigen/teichoic acid export membrane protein
MVSRILFKSSLIYALVGSLPMLSGFILLPFYTSDLLSIKNYGYLTLHLSCALLFQSIIIFCLENFIGPVVFESKRESAELKKKIASINYYTLLSAIIIIGSFLIFGPFIFKFGFREIAQMQFYPFIFITVITSFFNAYFKLYCNYLIYTEQSTRYLIANIVNFFATLGFSLIALYAYGDSIMGPLMGRLLSGVIIFIIAFGYLNKKYGLKSDSNFWIDIKRFCLPLILYFILNWVFNYADRVFIEKMLTIDLVGLFDFGIKCTLGIEILFTAMNNVIYPQIYTLIRENASQAILREKINKFASGYLIVIISSVILTLVMVPFAITFLIKNVYYHNALAFLAILSMGQLLKVMYYIYLSPLFYLKRTDLVAKSFFFSTIIQLIITYLLILYFGLKGIIVAYIVSKPLQILFVYIESNQFIHFPINKMKQIVLPITLCLVVAIAQLAIKDNNALYYNPMLGGILFIITLVFYRNEIMPFYNEFVKKIVFK